jgi:cAMP phosphodiesterase
MTMRLKVLGYSGGIGAAQRTTSFLVEEDILPIAGTGVGDLDLAALARVDPVFVTHGHVDHVTSIPCLVDNLGATRDKPLAVHALPETITDRRQHLFNWRLWPDFTETPSPERPMLRFAPAGVGDDMVLGERKIMPLPANHIARAVGYALH